MAVYAYKGVDATGKSVKGVRDADSAKALKSVLQKDGVFPTEILEQAAAKSRASREVDFSKYFQRVSTSELALATKLLSVLIRSGVPLVEALSALIDQLENEKLMSALTDARDKVNEGKSLASALGSHPKVFPRIYVSMVEAGEASGTLEAVLERLSDFLEGQAKLKSKITGALAYPIVMVLLSFAVITILMAVVVPQVTQVFESFDAALPWYTQTLIFVSDIMSNIYFLLFFGVVIGAGVFFFRRWVATPEGRLQWHTRLLKLPLFGKLIRLAAVARFSRTLGTLLESGVQILSAMEITKRVMGNQVLEDVVDEAADSVREGEGISKPLAKSGEFPPIVTHMVAIGEQSGSLEEMLEHVAEAYDEQVESRVEVMTSLLEPLVIVFMGVSVGFIVVSIMMPLMQMNEFVK